MATFLIAGLIIVYWQVPSNFDAATLSEGTHLVMHFTFLIVSGLIYLGSRSLTRRIRQIAPVAGREGTGLAGASSSYTELFVRSLPVQRAIRSWRRDGGYDARD